MATRRTRKWLNVKERKSKFAIRQTTRAEILHVEEEGYISPDTIDDDEEQRTIDLSQKDIKSSVDIFSAQKRFDLELPLYGPYHIDYTRNGRHLLLGGRKGHVAAFDWQTKKLHCEMNVMEQVNDVKWLHIETMFAVAQRQWTYIYDNQGLEVHCLKVLDRSLHLEFLPYHFLLVATNEAGYLSYIDVSIGKKVASFNTRIANGNGKCGTSVMCQNPSNALIGLGHAGGVLTFWSPNQREPLVKMLAHKSTLRSIAIDHTGSYMATSGVDAKLKIWDLRNYKCLNEYRTSSNGASALDFSQKSLLAASYRDIVEIYKDIYDNESSSNELPRYLSHRCPNGSSGSSLKFCPYEDILGVGHERGFVSLLVPGAGEPNFDTLEANPYQTKKQRKHAEVKQLLDKIQPDMITLDNSILSEIDRKGFLQKQEEKRKNFNFVKPKELIIKSDKKKGKISKRLTRKKQIHNAKLKEYLQQQQLRHNDRLDWLWVIGEVGISYGFYRWWKSHDKFLAILEVAPDIDINDLKQFSSSRTFIDYAAVHGIVRANDSKPNSVLTSQFLPHCIGVIQRLSLREKKLEKIRNVWAETNKTISDVTRYVPFRLSSPSGNYIRIDKPLGFKSIEDQLDVIHVKFEPITSSSMQRIVDAFIGDLSTGIETKEQMLLIDSSLTGVGRLEKRSNGIWHLVPHEKWGGILTRLSRVEIISQYRDRSYFVRVLSICFGIAAIGTAVYLLYKYYSKQRRENNRLPNIVSPNDINEIDNNSNARLRCIICLENEIIYSLQPCSHLGLCYSCAQTLQSRSRGEELCPLCRAPIEAYQRIFLP